MSLATRTILGSLSLERLRTLARDFDAEYLWPPSKGEAVDNLEKCPAVTVSALLDMLLFDELAKVCKVMGVDARAHRREALVARLLAAEGTHKANPARGPDDDPMAHPTPGPGRQAKPAKT